MRKLRILVADGSAMYKKMFAKAVEELDGNAAVTCVSAADEALDKIRLGDFEIIVIDAETRRLDELLKAVSSELPKAFVLITARPSSASDAICGDALTKGAADCLTKPIHSSYNENYDAIKQKLAAIIGALREKRDKKTEPPKHEREKPQKITGKGGFRPEIVLIAASTGGPLALEAILSEISHGFPIPVLVVQHMLPQFTETLAQNLNHKSRLRIIIAEDGEPIDAGTVYIAPGGLHMKLDEENRILLDDSPAINGIRPAADKLFESVADSFAGQSVLAVILTGMGRDGEKGLAALKQKTDCYCIAQSEKTCVVYGMPRVAIESGFADRILDLQDISQEIESYCSR